ncbi:MAG: hypothetical protein ONB16_12825 [candidate division KSB1 bacterium]|nr:hypothetical protein [candidate division KSB1 bacterium]MDZ7319209.1 hypothetical protein [candidate division KSB1 bacterium]
MPKTVRKKSPDRLAPGEIDQWRQLKKALDSMNQWEKQQQIKSRGQKTPQERLDEYLDLMDFVLRVAPAESDRAFKERMLHLIAFQNKLLTFERWRLAKQAD